MRHFPRMRMWGLPLKNRQDATSEAMLRQCEQLFWFQPATTLRGLLLGILNWWDTLYTEHIPNFSDMRFCDPDDSAWWCVWKKYTDSMITDMTSLANVSSYAKLPTRATARMRYFLHNMVEYHNTLIFPTKTFIRDLTLMFYASQEAFCNVSVEIHVVWLMTGVSMQSLSLHVY